MLKASLFAIAVAASIYGAASYVEKDESEPEAVTPPAASPAKFKPQSIAFALPIACTLGEDCSIQQYFDHDPGPGAKDYRCNSRSYDGHDGTDIRVNSLAAQARGVDVLAAADGTVRGIRDGEADRLAQTDSDRAAIAGKECGNGVVIAHSNGFETQYCHLAKGSVVVREGQTVRKGEKLGQVGLSGNTQFPHVHFAVRQGQRKIDPFLPDAEPGACLADGNVYSMWFPDAAEEAAYRSTEIINFGFAGGQVEMDAIERETVMRPTASTPLVFYGRAIGLWTGDTLRITVTDPAGQILAVNGYTADSPNAQWMLFTGKNPPTGGWKGTYKAEVAVIRGSKTVVSRADTITF